MYQLVGPRSDHWPKSKLMTGKMLATFPEIDDAGNSAYAQVPKSSGYPTSLIGSRIHQFPMLGEFGDLPMAFPIFSKMIIIIINNNKKKKKKGRGSSNSSLVFTAKESATQSWGGFDPGSRVQSPTTQHPNVEIPSRIEVQVWGLSIQGNPKPDKDANCWGELSKLPSY